MRLTSLSTSAVLTLSGLSQYKTLYPSTEPPSSGFFQLTFIADGPFNSASIYSTLPGRTVKRKYEITTRNKLHASL